MRSITSSTERETTARIIWRVIAGLVGAASIVALLFLVGVFMTAFGIVLAILALFALGGVFADEGARNGIVDRGDS